MPGGLNCNIKSTNHKIIEDFEAVPLGYDPVPLPEGEGLDGADGDGPAPQVVAELQDPVHQDQGQVVAQPVLPLLAVQDGPRAPDGADLQLQAELQLHLTHRPDGKESFGSVRHTLARKKCLLPHNFFCDSFT